MINPWRLNDTLTLEEWKSPPPPLKKEQIFTLFSCVLNVMLHLGPVSLANPLMHCFYTQAFTNGIFFLKNKTLAYGHWAHVRQAVAFHTCSQSVLRETRRQFEIRGAEMCLASAYLAAKGEKKENQQIILPYFFFFCALHRAEQHSFTVWPLDMPAHAAASEKHT